ncbi:4140_t:CDS:2, partial [Funneliformis geosporum]
TGSSFRWIEDKDIIVTFKLANLAVKLSSRQNLDSSILKRERTQTKEQIENIAIFLTYDITIKTIDRFLLLDIIGMWEIDKNVTMIVGYSLKKQSVRTKYRIVEVLIDAGYQPEWTG